MRKNLALAAALAALLAAPVLTPETWAQTTQPVPAQPSPRLLPQGPMTRNSTTAQTPPAAVQPDLSATPRTTLGATRPAAPANQVVNINTASEKDLDSLPGIGPVRAKTIIGGRPYASTQDLLSKHVLSQRIYDKIKNRIAVQ